MLKQGNINKVNVSAVVTSTNYVLECITNKQKTIIACILTKNIIESVMACTFQYLFVLFSFIYLNGIKKIVKKVKKS